MSVEAPEAPETVVTPAATAPEAPVSPEPATGTETDWKAEAALQKAEAERYRALARKQEDRSKQNHTELQQRDELLRQVAAKVGIEIDTDPDPAKLTRRLDEATAEARASKVELAVFRAASGTGADASALLDSRQFMNRAGALDPSADDFGDQVAALVTEAAQDARYKAPEAAQPARQLPSASGGGFGQSSGARMWTQSDYDRVVASGNMGELTKAMQAGLLANIGIPRQKTKTA